jgi:acyl-CoA thioesterase YciA
VTEPEGIFGGAEPEGIFGGAEPAIQVILLPKDTNSAGVIFGGVILHHLDLAGVVEAYKHANRRFVTVAINEVVFVAPVYVGDLVSFYTTTVRVGRTSVTVGIEVFARRRGDFEHPVKVTAAEIVYVAIDEAGKPTPINPE